MAGYTRQSSYTDGDVITAAHSNDEFNQVLAAFVNTTVTNTMARLLKVRSLG